MKSFKHVQLPLIVFLVHSCSPRIDYLDLNWQQGDDPALLKKIENTNSIEEKKYVQFKGNKIIYSTQYINGIPIENTFIKKTKDSRNSLKNVTARIADMNLVEKMAFTKYGSSSNTISNLTEQLELKHKNLKVKDYKFANLYKHELDYLSKTTFVEYELDDGTIWRGYFDQNNKITNTERLGSNFSEVTVNVFTLGPKLSPLSSDILLKNLDTKQILANEKVIVENDSTSKIQSISPVLKYNPQDDQFDQIQVFYYINEALNWMKSKLAVDFNTRIEAVVNVGSPKKTNTAFYYGGKIRIGRGDEIDYSMIASDPTIIYHESFHYLIDHMAHLPFQGEGGSLNEAFADFFTAIALNTPLMGESSSVKKPYRRSIDNKMSLQDVNGGLYHDSQIISGLLWELTSKIGQEKTLQLAISILADLNPASEFSDFSSALLKLSKEQLNANEQKNVDDVLKSRGFVHD